MKHGYRSGAFRLCGASAVMLAAAAVSYSALAAEHIIGEEDYGPFKEVKTAAGTVMADPRGMTLYTNDNDEAEKSNCVDQCAVNWRPVTATAADKPIGDLTIIKRPDGTLQWVDEGKPLYTYSQDKKPGDVKGDKVKEGWHAVME